VEKSEAKYSLVDCRWLIIWGGKTSGRKVSSGKINGGKASGGKVISGIVGGEQTLVEKSARWKKSEAEK
jgi:hypothetical protein